MKHLEIEIMGITDAQKLMAFQYSYYQCATWNPKVGDYYTITRADNQLCRIVGEDEDHFYIKLSWPNWTSSEEAQPFTKEGFNTEGFGRNRMFCPMFIFQSHPIHSSSSDSYFLHSKNAWSHIASSAIRSKFETRMVRMGYSGKFERFPSGCYEDDFLQNRWEAYYNGFRDAEDSV